MTPQMAQQGSHEARHVNGLEVVDLEADIQAHMLALGGYCKGRQGRDAVMLVGVGDDRRVTRRGPGSPPRGNKQKATFIQEGQVGTQAVGFFLSPATCSASTGRSPARRAGWDGAPAPDSSSPGAGGSSRHAQGDSAPQSGPGSRRQCASRSTARWESQAPGPLSVRAAPMARGAGRSICAAP
jgi:hypothetical protein